MCIERKPISAFRQLTLNAQWPSDTDIAKHNIHPNMLVFRDLTSGEIVGQVNADDLFDVDGNRFWLDA